MLITPEKVCFERLYCAVRCDEEADLNSDRKEIIKCCDAIPKLKFY
jgi:hypothetical protein